jgi:phenylacetic acid degradation protein
VVGAPARVLRPLQQKEVDWKKGGTQEYRELAIRSHESLRPVTPLEEDDPGRERVKSSGFKPKRES